jgi:putative oxidoreductase
VDRVGGDIVVLTAATLLATRAGHYEARSYRVQSLQRLHPGYGIAVVRIMAGIVLLVAGYQKLMGPGVAGMAGFLGKAGIPAPEVMVPLLIAFEIVGGLLLILGLGSRFLGAAMIVEFLVAGFVVSLPSPMGWNAARMDFLMLACGALFLLSGGGLLSLDGRLAARGRSRARAASFA